MNFYPVYMVVTDETRALVASVRLVVSCDQELPLTLYDSVLLENEPAESVKDVAA
jgi:hypothetical protein